jgi:hypothetical protein
MSCVPAAKSKWGKPGGKVGLTHVTKFHLVFGDAHWSSGDGFCHPGRSITQCLRWISLVIIQGEGTDTWSIYSTPIVITSLRRHDVMSLTGTEFILLQRQ